MSVPKRGLAQVLSALVLLLALVWLVVEPGMEPVITAVVGVIGLIGSWGAERSAPSPDQADPASPAVSALEVPESMAARSILVLPFDNVSPDEQDGYLSDGLTEEITTDLSSLGTLRVISRSSAAVFKARGTDVRTIGRELGVRYVLEGSVRKAGEALRITAQLIDARLDEHVWAERYRGTMRDVFSMQESVSRSVVAALEIQLTPDEDRRLKQRPLEDLQAYEYYLRAREESWRFTEEALDRAVNHLERAGEITGDNPFVLSGLAYVYSQYVNLGIDPEENVRLAERYARRALALDPHSPQGHLVMGFLFEAVWRDPKRAVEHLERSLEGRPDDSHALAWLAVAYSLTGDYSGLRRAAERALKVDPLTPMVKGLRGLVPMMEGNFADAADHMGDWYRTEPDNPAAVMFYAFVLASSGRIDASRQLLTGHLDSEPQSSFDRFSLLLKHAIEGNTDQMTKLLSGGFRDNMVRDTQFTVFTASVVALAGMKSEALDWVETAVEGGFTNYPWLSAHDPYMVQFRGDARFEAILAEVELRWRQDVGSRPSASEPRPGAPTGPR